MLRSTRTRPADSLPFSDCIGASPCSRFRAPLLGQRFVLAVKVFPDEEVREDRGCVLCGERATGDPLGGRVTERGPREVRARLNGGGKKRELPHHYADNVGEAERPSRRTLHQSCGGKLKIANARRRRSSRSATGWYERRITGNDAGV